MNIWLNGTLRSIRSKDASNNCEKAENGSKSKMCSKVDTHNFEIINIDCKTKTVMNRLDSETKAMDQKEIRPRTRSNVQVVNNVEHSSQKSIGECSLNFRLTRSKSKSNDESESSNVDTRDIKIVCKTKTVMNRSDSRTKAMDQTEIRPRSEHADGRRTKSNVQVINNDCENSTLNSRVTRSKAKRNDKNDFLDTERSSKRKRLLREQN